MTGRPRRTRRPVREERVGKAGKRGRPGSSGSDGPGNERRVPAWVVVPLTTLAGYAVSGVPGALFGLGAGLLLWWSRR